MNRALVLPFILLLTVPAWAQHPRSEQNGIHQGEQADAQAQQNIPPPLQQTRSVDSAKLKRDADELASLAASVPSAVAQTTQGVLPNDLLEKLKKIERLSKRLRSEINP